MSKQIPIYFESVIVESPFQEISQNNPNLGRLKVRVFTRYGNRNGSYITEKVAQQLINSATNGMTPVVGFFDPESKKWSSHSGPTLANAYGYVESFLGWEPFRDTDGITREYAVFSVVLFTNYFEEAKNIFGQNQSMELDPASITGEWTLIDDEEYYVYKTAKMLGFCIIGEHEPCFSVSAFFSKKDNEYSSQFEKFSSLLSDLKTQVEEAEKNLIGGEQPMDEFNKQEQEEVLDPVVNEEEAPQNFEEVEEVETEVKEEESVSKFEENENTEETEEKETEEETESVNNFEILYNELQTSYSELQTNYENAQTHITELENTIENNKNTFEELNNKISILEAQNAAFEEQKKTAENAKKEELFKKYEEVLTEEEISSVRADINNFSYEELNSKLAVIFAKNKMSGSEINKVPLTEQPETQFTKFMKKYKKDK